MRSFSRISPYIVIAGIVLSSAASPASAKDRVYHRLRDSHIIVIPERVAVPQGLRQISPAEIDRLLPKPQLAARTKYDKYHQIDSTRIVWLRTSNPSSGYTKYEPGKDLRK